MRRIPYSIAGFEDEEVRPQVKKCRWYVEAENNPQPKAGNETGTLVPQLQGTEF